MSAERINLLIEKGATFNQVFQWQDSTGTPIPLTDYSARMHIRKNKNSGLEAELTTANGKITLDAPNGLVTLYIGAVETDTFTFQTGVYDLELYKVADVNEVTRLIEGIVTISTAVTQD